MISVCIEDELKQACPEMALGILQCRVVNNSFHDLLWAEIQEKIDEIADGYTLSTIKEQPAIKKTREVYRTCGKDPNRYRPSADSLYRRIVKGMGLYQITTLVDLVNLISLKTGYSIGGFDADKIAGDVRAGVGRKDEPYEGIGRGKLNIENMPVLRDNCGGIGTPTSDEVRTAIDIDTTHFFMNVNAYTGQEGVDELLKTTMELLEKYVHGGYFEYDIITV